MFIIKTHVMFVFKTQVNCALFWEEILNLPLSHVTWRQHMLAETWMWHLTGQRSAATAGMKIFIIHHIVLHCKQYRFARILCCCYSRTLHLPDLTLHCTVCHSANNSIRKSVLCNKQTCKKAAIPIKEIHLLQIYKYMCNFYH